MADPYTIRIFVPYGNPDGLRIIDRMNWTGLPDPVAVLGRSKLVDLLPLNAPVFG